MPLDGVIASQWGSIQIVKVFRLTTPPPLGEIWTQRERERLGHFLCPVGTTDTDWPKGVDNSCGGAISESVVGSGSEQGITDHREILLHSH